MGMTPKHLYKKKLKEWRRNREEYRREYMNDENLGREFNCFHLWRGLADYSTPFENERIIKDAWDARRAYRAHAKEVSYLTYLLDNEGIELEP